MVGRLAQPPASCSVCGKFPVVERGPGSQSARQHAVDQARIEIQAGRIWRVAAVAIDARPGNRKAVGCHAKRRGQIQVLLPAVVVVAGGVGVAGIADRATLAAESVPDRVDPTALHSGDLDLEGGGGTAPHKAGAKIGAGQLRCRVLL